MSDNKKYYYLKFKESWFEQDHIKVIEAMKNGYEYSLIILKIYLKSLKFDGQLRINERIPYSSDKMDLLAGVLGHDPANVMHAVNIGKDLGIIEILTTGEIFMADIQNFIGQSSTEGDRKRKYRKKIEAKNGNIKQIGQTSDKRPPELEIDIELELDLEQGWVLPSSLSACKEFQHTWKEWLTYKKESSNKLTPTTARAQLEMLEKRGPEKAVEMIKESILNGWKGLSYAIKSAAPVSNPAVETEWNNILAAIKAGFGKEKELSEPTQKALQDIGGLSRLRAANDFKTAEMKRDFLKVYGE